MLVVRLYPVSGTKSCWRVCLNSVGAKRLADVSRQRGGQSSISARTMWDLWRIEWLSNRTSVFPRQDYSCSAPCSFIILPTSLQNLIISTASLNSTFWWYDMIYMICLLTSIGWTPGGSSTLHIYTQTVQQYITHLHTNSTAVHYTFTHKQYSSTLHIYIQTVHRTTRYTQNITHIAIIINITIKIYNLHI
jgi:hypothetical protein